MKYSLLPVVVLVALIAALAPGASEVAHAKGGVIAFTPDAGPIGDEMTVWSDAWPAATEVELYAAFSSDSSEGYSGSAEFVGPIAVVTSDDDGHWEATIQPDTIANLDIPNVPGYLFLRADSEGLPPFLQSFTVSHFIVTVDGQRPAGSGEIEVSLSMAEGEYADLALWGSRLVGGSHFTTGYGLVPVPFEPTMSSLRDGEYEIVAVTNGGHEPIGPNTVDVSGARLCLNPACGDAPIVQVHSAFRVRVKNAQVVEADVLLGRLPDPEGGPSVNALAAFTNQEDSGRTALIVGTSVLLTLFVLGVAAFRLRGATSQ